MEKCEKKRFHSPNFPEINQQLISESEVGKLFDNLPKLMRPKQAATFLDISIGTIYDWRHRGCLKGIPKELFMALNRRLYIRTDVLLDWIASQNPGFDPRK